MAGRYQQRRMRRVLNDYNRLKAEFARANERAASFKGEKTQILRIATQDLSGPFSELSAELEKMAGGTTTSPEQTSRMERVRELTARMQRAFSALKEIQTLEDRSQSIILLPVNIGAVLVEAVANSQDAASKKQVRLSLPVPGKTSVAMADAQVLRKSIENLIGDAIDVTPLGGAVSLSLYETPDRVLITVADEGPGAAVSDQAQLLSQSGHSRPPFDEMSGGLRLNLAMVHNLIKAMNGWLWSQSEPGRGTTHVIELALSGAPAKT